MSAPAERYHALDALRGFAMLLGVGLHAALSLLDRPPPFWPVWDDHSSPAFDVAVLAVHDFRMQLFFLLAGFFGRLVCQRYGVGGMLWHRLKRVGLPFVLAVVLVLPTVLAVGLYAGIETARREHDPARGEYAVRWINEIVAAAPDRPTGDLVLDQFRSGAILARFTPLHLWFLYYLLLCFALAAVAVPLARRPQLIRLAAVADAAFRKLAGGGWRVPALALLFLPLMFAMGWAVDTPTSWVPLPHLLAYYLGFFAVGWWLHRHRDLVVPFGRGWGANLLLANAVVFPLMLLATAAGAKMEKGGEGVHLGLKVASAVASTAYTWLMITGLWGAALRWFSHGSRWVRYLADASYWSYLVHLTPVLALQHLVSRWDAPSGVKLVLIVVATSALLAASYHWLVRRTVVGTLLNGPRPRPAPPAGPSPGGGLIR
jgi:glucan biosynthesis protein C